jgi:YjbE family integral membrane protein
MELETSFWLALIEIIGINIILSGDNAVVIALACRSLPGKQRRLGVMLGAGAAVAMRIVFAIFIAYLLTIPYLKILGGLLLFWIGYKLMQPEEGEGDGVDGGSSIWSAVRMILIADAVMSLDNVIAVAAAANGNYILLSLGLLISVPLVVYGATLMITLLNRFPIIVVMGAALIGYIGGEVVVTDPVWDHWIDANLPWLHFAAPVLGGAIVVVTGRLFGVKPVPSEIEVPETVAAAASVFGGRFLLRLAAALLIGRSPLIVTFIATMLGYTGGQLAMGEPHLSGWADAHLPVLHTVLPIAAAAALVIVVEIGFRLWARHRALQGRRVYLAAARH